MQRVILGSMLLGLAVHAVVLGQAAAQAEYIPEAQLAPVQQPSRITDPYRDNGPIRSRGVHARRQQQQRVRSCACGKWRRLVSESRGEGGCETYVSCGVEERE